MIANKISKLENPMTSDGHKETCTLDSYSSVEEVRDEDTVNLSSS